MDIEAFMPAGGRLLDENGNVVNIVALLGGGLPKSDAVYDPDVFASRSGRVIGEDGKVYNLVDLLRELMQRVNAGGGATGGTVGNVVVSDTEPLDNSSIWFQTGSNA